MSLVLPVKVVLFIVLAAAGGSVGGISYYYQARALDLNNQVSNLSNNDNALSNQIALLKIEIENLTIRISQLQTVNSQLNQTSLQLQSLEAELAAANAQLETLSKQLSDEIDKVQALEASFNTQLDSLRAQLAADQAEIAQLQALVAQLQSQLASANGLCSSGKTLNVGELLDLSSALSDQGLTSKKASLLAINDVNSFLSSFGCNLQFTLTVDDYALDNAVALAELQSLAASGVQVVVGPLNSGAALYILSFADSNHIVLISPSSSSDALGIANDYLFRTAPTNAAQSPADARMMVDRGATAVIIVERHDIYGDAIANATAARFKALGGQLVNIIPYDTSSTDFTPIVNTLYNDYQLANATYPGRVAIDVVSFEEFSQFIIQTNALHPSLLNGALPWFGTDGVAQDVLVTLNSTSGALASKVRLPSTLYVSQNNSKTVSFYTKFASTYPGTVCSVYCLGAYDDVWLAALATLQVGSYNGTRIQAALLTVASNYYGVTGWLGLDQNGDRIPGMYQIWKVVNAGSPPSPTWVFAGTWDATADSVNWTSPP